MAGGGRELGPARVRGSLWDLGGYPGLVPDERALGWVAGELWELQGEEIWAPLDRYEGIDPDEPEPQIYRRDEIEVFARDVSNPVRAWVYVFIGSTAGHRPIASGDWLAMETDSS